jgi:hypothetical protein
MLQIRLTKANGTEPVIIERAANIVYSKALNSSSEGIAFEIAKADPKASMLSPYNPDTYTRLWEVWDTIKNQRLNFGPLDKIDDSPGIWKVSGRGRSALLEDHFLTLKTFYGRIDAIVDELRFENVAVAPTSKALVADLTPFDDENTFDDLLTYAVDDKYYNLSKYSKDFVIDDQSAYIPFGKVEPPRTFTTTSEYWTGMSIDDSIGLDFGDVYRISKIRLLFPWWGGPQRSTNRTYDFEVLYSEDVAASGTLAHGRPINRSHKLFDSSPELYQAYIDEFGFLAEEVPSTARQTLGNRIVTTPKNPINLYIGTTMSGTATNLNTFYTALDKIGPIDMRYLSIHIYNVNAWYGNSYDTKDALNYYPYQCAPEYRPNDISALGSKLGLMTYRKKNGTIVEREIPDTAIKPSNDCHASVIEIGAFQEIVNKKAVKPLALQRIDNNNRQISYYRVPNTDELRSYIRDGIHFLKFEPGTLFRKFGISWDGATTNYTKFFKKDCTNCYPDSFHFGIIDDDNTLILSSDSTSGTDVEVKGRQYTKHIITKGSSTPSLTWVDAWRGQTDPLSWGGSFSYTEKASDEFVVHFRGESFKWYATIPSGKTGARVIIQLRHKYEGDRRSPSKSEAIMWSSYTTLETDFKLPDGDISNQVVYEIPYGSGILQPETVYEFRVILLDDNYCSIDSIEGYWSASFTEYNEDSTRINLSQVEVFKQIYNKRFTGGSMYKWNKPGASASLQFEGDRIIIQSARGRYHGKLTLLLFQYNTNNTVEYDPGVDNHIFIPGGDPTSGELIVDLNTGKRGQEIPNAIIFDSNDFFPQGLPWGKYTMSIAYTPAEKYSTTKYETGSDSFQYRCSSCNPKTSTAVEIYKYVYLDAIGVHERIGLSVDFDEKHHLEILSSIAEAIQVEWDVAESGLMLEPRLGRDTDIALREGEGTLVEYSIANDLSKMATRLLSYGSAIDGIDMFAITEDKKSRKAFGRTITRQQDFRDIGSYQQLIGLSRTELRRRTKPEKRVVVRHTAPYLDLVRGDSFILWTKESGNIRLRIQSIEISESGGTSFNMECVEWPQIQ